LNRKPKGLEERGNSGFFRSSRKGFDDLERNPRRNSLLDLAPRGTTRLNGRLGDGEVRLFIKATGSRRKIPYAENKKIFCGKWGQVLRFTKTGGVIFWGGWGKGWAGGG